MIAVGLRFLSGRFHATPWGKHVNEGVPEWPPSPWRLLRGLIAVWKTRYDATLPVAEVEPIFRALAEAPRFILPPAAVGHSRHYMRWYKKGPTDQVLVFDTFVALDRLDRDAEVVLFWPDAELTGPQREVLQQLVEHLGFVGRAESWCDARLFGDNDAVPAQVNCMPLECGPAEADQGKRELVRVLCADPQAAFAGEEARDYDPNWHLCIETSLLHAEGWSDPPGSKWVRYLRPVDCFEVKPKPSRPRTDRPRMQVARFVLDSAVLPLAQETLPVGEAARWALMGIYGRLTEQRDGAKGRSPVFSGKDASGQPLEGHGHAYYLPTDQDGDGRLDHLTVVAEGSFGPVELKALDRLRTLKRGEELPPLNVLLLGMGTLDEFLPLPLKAARIWISATPFVVTRHPKRNGQKRDPSDVLASRALFVQQVVKEELDRFCERRHLPWRSDAIQIEPLTDENGVFRVDPSEWTGPEATGPMLRPLQFKRFRRRRDDDGGVRPAGTFRVTFPEPVRGPVSLGYSSHFGLGLFVPARQP